MWHTALLLLLAASASAFDFDDELAGADALAGGQAYFGVDANGAGDISVPVTYMFGSAKLVANFVIRGGTNNLANGGRVRVRTSPVKMDAGAQALRVFLFLVASTRAA